MSKSPFPPVKSFFALALVLVLLYAAFHFFTPDNDEARPAPAPAPSTSAAPLPAPSVPVEPETPVAAEALAALAQLSNEAAVPAAKYDREAHFGRAWIDVDGNGCDTRNDILQRDLVVSSMDGSCTVLTGVLQDPYTGKTIDFVRGQTTSMAVQIDHIIALSWAWQNGASYWDEDTRLLFANDPANLLASDGPTNSSKGDRGPSEWMPLTPEYHCTYSLKTVEVLVKYELSVPESDEAALVRGLESCAA